MKSIVNLPAKFNLNFIFNFLLVFICLFGIWIRFSDLGRDAFWYDEIASVFISQLDLSAFYKAALMRDSQPPLFVFMLKLWSYIFGYSEYGARSLSALLGSLSILATYQLARIVGNKQFSLLCAAIFSLHQFTLWYSEELRPYCLLMLLSIYSLNYFLRYFSYKSHLTHLIVTNTLLLLTHYYGIFIIVFQNIIVCLFISHKNQVRQWFFSQTFILAAISFWFPGLSWHVFYKRFHHLQSSIETLDLINVFSPFIQNHYHMYIKPSLFLLFLLTNFILSIKIIPRRPSIKLKTKRTSSFKFSPTHIAYLFFLSLILNMASIYFIGGWYDLNISDFDLINNGIQMIIASYLGLGFLFLINQFIVQHTHNMANLLTEKPHLILLAFIVFVLLCVKFLNLYFRPNFQSRNIILLTSPFICLVVLNLYSSLKKTVAIFTFTILIALQLTYYKNYQSFQFRRSYKDVVTAYETIAQSKPDPLPKILVFSRESKYALNHYLKPYQNQIIDCSKDNVMINCLDSKDYFNKPTFWVIGPDHIQREQDAIKQINLHKDTQRVLGQYDDRKGSRAIYFAAFD